MPESLYRRPLPPGLVAFAAPEGRALFDGARAAGGMESFFPLIEQFHTQAEPAFCGLGTLVVALNALGVDPGRLWKGPWRWFSEELLDCCKSLEHVRSRGLTLDCCKSLEHVRSRGLTLDEFACLARCNGASAGVFRPDAHGLAEFRAALQAAAGSRVDPALIVAYDRAALGQSGVGHFSPIGGYDPATDHALVLDVARFKYPPHWVRVPALYAAMQPLDAATGRPRGWVTLRRGERPASLLFTARCVADESIEALPAALAGLKAAVAARAHAGLDAALRAMFAAASGFPVVIERRELALREHGDAAEALRAALRDTQVFASVAAAMAAGLGEAATVATPSDLQAEVATVLALALPDDVWSPLPAELRAAWLATLERGCLSPAVRAEVEHVRGQLADLCALSPAGGCGRCG